MKTNKLILIVVGVFFISPVFAQTVFLGTGAGAGGTNNTHIGTSSGNIDLGAYNSFLGYYSGFQSNNGKYNTALGAFSGSNTTGASNTFSGYASGYLNTTGNNNTFYGNYSGFSSTTASNNTFLGNFSGYNNSTGARNTFVGNQSGILNTTGFSNSFIGNTAGYKNTTGRSNTFVGDSTGYNNTVGSSNSFFGYSAGVSNTTGGNNTFIGQNAGLANTTGYANSFIGFNAGANNPNSGYNTMIGYYSGYNGSGGYYNTFLGPYAGYNNGNYGNFIGGYAAGYNNSTGGYNVFLGYLSGYNNNGSNNVFLGRYAGYSETGSNKLLIDNSSDTIPLIYGDFTTTQVGIGTKTLGTYALSVNGGIYGTSLFISSDQRFKQNAKSIPEALTTVNKLDGKTYEFKNGNSSDGRKFDPGTQYGFIAQELEAVLPELVKTDGSGYKAVNYQAVIPILVEAIKELSAKVKAMEGNLEGKNTFQPIKGRMIPGVSLFQNQPNPFNGFTEISYELPVTVTKASLYIYDYQGSQVAVFDQLKQGKNNLSFSGGKLKPGIYYYSLEADGSVVETKKMIVKE